jgi:Xaa-Pro dipeptidase
VQDLIPLFRAHVEHLTNRARAAMSELGFDHLLVHAGSALPKSRFDDQDWPYKPSPPFAHFAPVSWPGSAIVIEGAGQPKLRTIREDSYWERRTEPHWDLLGSALALEEVHQLDRPSGKGAFVGDDVGAGKQLGYEESAINPPSLIERLEDVRVFKTPYEIACLAAATAIAVRGHRAVREAFEAGERSELALHLAYLGATDQDDSSTPYKNIVALGENAAVLHHVDYSREEREKGSLLVDAGAMFLGYGSDITRTWVVPNASGAAAEFRGLIEAMERLQQEVIASIRVGLPYEELHDSAHVRLAGVLKSAGIVTGTAEAAVETGVTRAFLPHGLGHSLGIQVHDVGCKRKPPKPENPWLRNTRTIEPDQVFTIEPGLYFIRALLDPMRSEPRGQLVAWDRVESLLPFGGIRIEDNVQVLGGQGPNVRNLTREAFAALS